jgi:hypothetical protein
VEPGELKNKTCGLKCKHNDLMAQAKFCCSSFVWSNYKLCLNSLAFNMAHFKTMHIGLEVSTTSDPIFICHSGTARNDVTGTPHSIIADNSGTVLSLQELTAQRLKLVYTGL